jgi:hypothetical protein
LTSSLHRAVEHLLSLQGERGDWEGEMVWCPMITAQYVIVQRVVGRPPDAATRGAIIRYFERTRTGDGAWGLHPESPGFVFVTALGVLWKRVGPQLVQRSEFQLTEQSLIVSPQPEWIHPKTNIKADVIRDGSLRNVNLLDPQSAVKIADAFKLHAWVKRVVRVQKQAPAQVVVELEYRRPVALVEVVYNNVLSYEPVDAEAVVLPEDLFHHDEKQLANYLRITSDYSMPTGSLGTPWGDDRITGAAHIAALLQTAWQEWQLSSIVVQSTEEGLPTPERQWTFRSPDAP